MSILFFIYLVLYAGIVLVNCLYWLLLRQKLVLVLYAFAAGSYLTFLGVAFFSPQLQECLSFYNVPLMLVILGVDFHSTLKWRDLDIKMVFPQMDDELVKVVRKYSVIEWAKAVPVLIASPLYIIGLLVLIDLVKRRLCGE